MPLKSKITRDNLTAAFEAGQTAAHDGKLCIPAQCKIYREIISDFKIGEGSAQVACRWIEGFKEAKNHQLPKAA